VRERCPDRLVRGHADCDRCDVDAVRELGPNRVQEYLPLERVKRALERIAREDGERR
jgi:hypothetical protein